MSEGFGVYLARLLVPPYSEIAVRAYNKSEVLQLAFESCGLDGHPCGRGDGVCPWWPGSAGEDTVRVIAPPLWPRPGVVLATWHPRRDVATPVGAARAICAHEVAPGVFAEDEPATFTLVPREEG